MLGDGGGVRGCGASCRGLRVGLVRAGCDAGVAPPLAAGRHELLALVGRGPCRALSWVHSLSRRQVGSQAHESHIPSDTDCAGTELGPPFVVDVSDVLELEARPALRLGRKSDFDPADVPAVLPGGGKTVRRVATLDLPARVALELVEAPVSSIS